MKYIILIYRALNNAFTIINTRGMRFYTHILSYIVLRYLSFLWQSRRRLLMHALRFRQINMIYFNSLHCRLDTQSTEQFTGHA